MLLEHGFAQRCVPEMLFLKTIILRCGPTTVDVINVMKPQTTVSIDAVGVLTLQLPTYQYRSTDRRSDLYLLAVLGIKDLIVDLERSYLFRLGFHNRDRCISGVSCLCESVSLHS